MSVSAEHRTTTTRGDKPDADLAKGERLRRKGRIHPVVVRGYIVEGDHGTYLVTLGAGFAHCSCPAPRDCSHLSAARQTRGAELLGEAVAVAHHRLEGGARG